MGILNIRKKNESGFTLVELMIVVAIIGILASIAIPNYQKYQARSRTTEAKVNLTAIYTGEKSWAVEYSSFTACIGNAGFQPEGNSYYTIGFSADPSTCGTGNALSCVGNLNANAPTCAAAVNQIHYLATNTVTGAAVPAAATLTNTLTATTFTVRAVGTISGVGNDVWQITDTKALTNTTVGY